MSDRASWSCKKRACSAWRGKPKLIARGQEQSSLFLLYFFRSKEWLHIGWSILEKTDLDRDYWIPELNTRELFLNKPPTYLRTLQWLRFFTSALWAAEHRSETIETMRIRQVLKDLTIPAGSLFWTPLFMRVARRKKLVCKQTGRTPVLWS